MIWIRNKGSGIRKFGNGTLKKVIGNIESGIITYYKFIEIL
jgi:hypothetical protein